MIYNCELIITQPSRSREVDRGVIDDSSHIPDHQISAQIPETQTDHSTDGRILQTTSADQTANVSGVLPAIPVTLSDEPASQIPQPSSDVSTPILTDQPHEVGEPIMPDLSYVRACIARALVESGSEQPRSTDQDDLIQSLMDHAPGDIFVYLDQWDASTITAEASTRHATSSTVAGVFPNPTAEALLRSYRKTEIAYPWPIRMRETRSKPLLRH
ncbi:hypothetical protein L3X38_032937 [Prunus dulcis]|uniref:Uncharacterized protein n=1 Tax=Prunus dulcis TaxID=3755 RepID=A0AAD4VEY9_PRUDU|nr:hypothetical protein L3X38_032937 [Prunus dulcis]